mgnify:FL=1
MSDELAIYVQEEMCFVDLGAGYLFCFARKDEVEGATPDRIVELICHALTLRQFDPVKTVRGEIVQ